jgi:hypothetical protein
LQANPSNNSTASSYRPEDMQLVLYQPPPNPFLADPAAGAGAMLNINPFLLQQQAQQPNALAALWRSLTPGQRRSLAGMWDALRDQKMLAGMLRKLPAHDGPHESPAAAEQQQQQQATCVVEELGEGDVGKGQQQPASAAAVVKPIGAWPQPQVMPVVTNPAAGDSMMVDGGSEQQQQQQHDEGCGMDLD